MIAISGFLPTVILLCGLGIGAGAVSFWLYTERRTEKRPPFTKSFLRSPGESLRRQLDDSFSDVNVYLFSAMYMPVLIFAVYAGQALFGKVPSAGAAIFAILFAIAAEGYLLQKLVRVLRERNTLRLGWEGEIAVGEELNQLMLQGFRVFHDFPAEGGFNIDHVVIGSRGVLAVETKTRSKPARGQGSEVVKVRFDGKALEFPRFTEEKSVDQARRQARWMAKWLTSATGEAVPVFSVVALPGWYVERTSASRDIFVVGSGEIQKSFKTLGNARLTQELIQRIAHQVELRCRTVEAWTPSRPT